MSIVIFVPSRGRPKRCRQMVESVHKTAAGEVQVVVIVDADDPALADYEEALHPGDPGGLGVRIMDERVGYTGSLNDAAPDFWDDYDIIGAFGDDVLFRTTFWDQLIVKALAKPGIAYGNDLVHAAGHPTAVFMSSVIAKALGYLAIPQSRHLWVDDAWKYLGEKTGTLRYVPEALFEHMHPAVKKAEMDQTYHEVYDSVLGHNDHLGYLDWLANNADADCAKILRAVHA